tara:strand:- start:395 stop:718 length:324 start_codon:yes stop_codon:yes gene_type:complete
MSLDHEAIYKAYSDVIRIDDKYGAFKEDGTQVTLVQSDIDAARVELDKLKYQTDRVSIASTVRYSNIGIQLDQLYHDMADGKLGAGATTGSWFVGISSVKAAHPKPS